jgi:hypothetical protein
MALSDCVNCWETPCVCGHDYQNWSTQRLEDQIRMLQQVLEKRTAKTPSDVKPKA